MDLQSIAGNMLKSAATGEICRLWARELSELKPQLDAHNVRLVAVGLEEFGLQAFVDGDFFKGEIFIDMEKKCYKDLEFKRYNVLSLVGGLASKETRNAISRSNALGIKGDMKGDGWQNGGDLIVSKGGEKVLLFHKQANPGDHPKTADMLKALSIPTEVQEGAAGPGATTAQHDNPSVEETKESETKQEGDETKETDEVPKEKSGNENDVKSETTSEEQKLEDPTQETESTETKSDSAEDKKGDEATSHKQSETPEEDK